MEEKLRDSGIDVIGHVAWGTHFCQFYQTRQDLIDILVPYFKAGLENNEFCMWITSTPLLIREAKKALSIALPDMDSYLKRGQLEILPHSRWYLKNGTFDADRVLQGWVSKLETAKAGGFSGLRLSGNTFWLEKSNWADFTEYEARVNSIIGSYEMLALCTYSLKKCNSIEVIDVIRNHQFALIYQYGKWELVESSIYRQAKEALYESEERFRSLFEESPVGLELYDSQGKLIAINKACLNIFGAREDDVKGFNLFADPNVSAAVKNELRNGETATYQSTFDFGLVKKHRLYETKKDGVIDTDVNITPLASEKGYLVQVQDITERKHVEERMVSLSKFPSENPNPVLRISARGNIMYANIACQSLLELWQTGEGQVLPRHYRQIAAKTLSSGVKQEIEIDCNGRILNLTFVPIENMRYVNIYGIDITERKKVEESLKESQRDLNHAQAVAFIGSWRLDVRNNELLWSDEAYRIFGIPERTPMTYEAFLSSVHPDDREYVDRMWTEALHGEHYDIEHRIIVRGETKWVREKAQLEFDQYGVLKSGFGTVQDITEHKETVEKITFQARLLDAIEDSILATDIDGRIIYWGNGAENLLGWRSKEVIGHIALDVLVPEKAMPRVDVIQSLLKNGQNWSGEFTTKCKDGTSITLLVHNSPVLDKTGKVIGIIAVGKDFTEHKKLEQMKDEFISLVSHELRTPLTVIMASIRILLSEDLSLEDKRELLQSASDSADALASILDNLLELSRHQANRLVLYSEPLSISNTVQNVIAKMKIHSVTQRFSVDIPTRLPQVQADPVRVERIVFNLLENAAKYSPTGSEIRVFASRENNSIVIGINDQGAGLSPDEQQKLFEPFQRFSKMPSAQGLGLGLVVCKRLVEAQGGRIWVESQPGQGSTFFFSLPLAKENISR